MALHTASAHAHLPHGAHRRLQATNKAAVRTVNTVRLLVATIVLLSLTVALSGALVSGAQKLQNVLDGSATAATLR
ncbi:MAG: hypothetical protein ACREOU_02255 [Candidatus Eiseniibacteriota bacterium]|jgi:hypothetical protein